MNLFFGKPPAGGAVPTSPARSSRGEPGGQDRVLVEPRAEETPAQRPASDLDPAVVELEIEASDSLIREVDEQRIDANDLIVESRITY